MPSGMSILDLPNEIHLAIIDQLNVNFDSERSPLLRLSESCSFYRTLLLPYIFRSIRIRNKQIGWAARDVIVTGNIRHYVKELHFIGSALGNTYCDSGLSDDYNETDRVLPKTVRSILAELKCFPHLEKLIVEFDFDFKDQNKWCYVPQIFNEQENCQQVLMAEATEPWRALMSKVWDALVENKHAHFKALAIRQMVPKEVSTFRKPEFGKFLNGIENFSLMAHGDVTGERDNILEGVEEFYSRLSGFMFDHLSNVSHLALTASERGPLGLTKDTFDECLPMPLVTRHMNLIESVHLEGVWVCPDLLDVLVSRVATLRSITMRNCMGHAPEEGSAPDLRWAHLFAGLADSSPKHLRRFIVESNSTTSIAHQESNEETSYVEAEKIRAVRSLLRAQPDRRQFSYQYCDAKSGSLRDDKRVIRTAFLRGDDQTQYNRLMQIVAANGR